MLVGVSILLVAELAVKIVSIVGLDAMHFLSSSF